MRASQRYTGGVSRGRYSQRMRGTASTTISARMSVGDRVLLPAAAIAQDRGDAERAPDGEAGVGDDREARGDAHRLERLEAAVEEGVEEPVRAERAEDADDDPHRRRPRAGVEARALRERAQLAAEREQRREDRGHHRDVRGVGGEDALAEELQLVAVADGGGPRERRARTKMKIWSAEAAPPLS